METLLVKIFATALSLSQVTTAPDAVVTRFDRVANQTHVAAPLLATMGLGLGVASTTALLSGLLRGTMVTDKES
jgi:hypothetical protein